MRHAIQGTLNAWIIEVEKTNKSSLVSDSSTASRDNRNILAAVEYTPLNEAIKRVLKHSEFRIGIPTRSQIVLLSNNHMHRKRKIVDTEKTTKRQRVHEPDWTPTAAYWDSLSFIPLTRSALREHDRRTEQIQTVPQRPKRNQFKYKIPPRIARHGGLDLTDLRGYMPVTRSKVEKSRVEKSYRSRKSSSRKSEKSGPYDGVFEQHLIDAHILPYGYKFPDGTKLPKPNNWDIIQERCLKRRDSVSISDEEHERFMDIQANASGEKQVSETVLPIIEGTIEDAKTRHGGVKFSNLKSMAIQDFVPGNPDVYYGARPEQIKPEVRKALNELIIPSNNKHWPAAPNFMLACKGPQGTLSVAYRQASYDGSLGARGINALRGSDGNAYCVSSIYLGGSLKMYTVHFVDSFYVMFQIGAWDLTGDADIFQRGVSAYRNLRDWAKEERNRAIEIANGKV